MTIHEIETAALSLDLKARAALAEKLLVSLHNLSDEEINHLWTEEAQRRDEELDSGKASASDAGEVFRNLRARLT